MAYNVFISFRYSDGHMYKEDLSARFNRNYDTVDFSEDVNRSSLTDATIQGYLYRKLKRSSVTIVLLTPMALNHQKDYYGRYSDWMYDEIRYSLENREGNKTNGIIAVYTKDVERYLIKHVYGGIQINPFDNLCYHNINNVKMGYKMNRLTDKYDPLEDSYCSLIPYEQFVLDIPRYINNAVNKKNNRYKYNVVSRLQ